MLNVKKDTTTMKISIAFLHSTAQPQLITVKNKTTILVPVINVKENLLTLMEFVKPNLKFVKKI